MENCQLNDVIIVDLRKAFNLVDTNILLHKLALYHCDKSSISWFTSYLHGRIQSVQFTSATSSTIPVTHGDRQGKMYTVTTYSVLRLTKPCLGKTK